MLETRRKSSLWFNWNSPGEAVEASKLAALRELRLVDAEDRALPGERELAEFVVGLICLQEPLRLIAGKNCGRTVMDANGIVSSLSKHTHPTSYSYILNTPRKQVQLRLSMS